MESSTELDLVVLKRDLDKYGLKEGDIGTIVHVYHDAIGLEVEFVTGNGTTVAVETLAPGDVRPMGDRDILHARKLAV